MAFRYWIGSLLIIIGAGALIDQIYPFDFWNWFSMFWPLAVILLGVLFLLTRSATLVGGILVIFFGLVFQVAALGIMTENFWGLFWPGLLILIGILFVFRLGRPAITLEKGQDQLNQFALFSGVETRFANAVLRGGSVTALFGGANIDLRDSTLPPEGAFIELTAAFGGVEVKIPDTWRVDLNGIPLFGGWSNHTRNSGAKEGGPLLTVRCLAMFGGIEIKN